MKMFAWFVFLSSAFLLAIFENAGVIGTSKVQTSSADKDLFPDKRAFTDPRGHKSAYNLTYCSFNFDSCAFTVLSRGNFNIKRVTRNSNQRYTNPPIVERTWGTANMGYYIGAKYGSIDRLSNQYDMGSPPLSARVKSAFFTPADHYCLMFWYNLKRKPGYDDITIDVSAAVSENGYSNPAIHLDTPTVDWKLAQFDFDEEYSASGLQFLFTFKTPKRYSRHRPRAFAGIDDVYIYNISCSDVPKHPWTRYVFKTTNFTSYYTFHVEKEDWESAFLTCREEGAMSSLVSVETQKEQEYLVRTIKNSAALTQAGKNGGFYTSGNDIADENSFLWSGNYGTEKFSYTNWKPGQPNNVKGGQNCVALEYSSLDYSWGDVNCSKPLSFICETRLPTNGVGEEYLG